MPSVPSSHASATCGIVAPRSLGDLRPPRRRRGSCARSRAARRPPRASRRRRRSGCPPAGARRACTCRVRKPAPSGPQGITPSPAARQNGRISTSIERSTSEYCGCSEMNGDQPSRSCSATDQASSQAGKFETPSARTLPARTSPSSAASVSSSGTLGIGRVHLVEVDLVDAEPPQAGVARLRDPLRARALRRPGPRPGSGTWSRARPRRAAAPARARASPPSRRRSTCRRCR